MAFVIDDTTLYGLVFAVIITVLQIGKQGGPKIVFWRLLGIKWFMRVEKQPDGTAIRKAYNWKVIKTHSLPSYNVRGKDYFVGGPRETVRIFGGPQWVYNYNDSRPLPLEHLDYDKTGGPIDPTVIHSAFENKSIEAFNQMSKKPDKFRWGMFGFAIMLIVILGIISVWYSYYFGINANCALHSKACPP
jgi:hypothetical protein